jgi:hypothetical protein
MNHVTTQPLDESLNRFVSSKRQAHNKQLQRTVTWHRGRDASARFQYALASRIARQRAAAELRR